MKQVRLGIIGIGNMGTAHARNILEGKCPEIALAAVTDMSEARRAWAKDNLPADVAVFDTVEDMLDSGRIDAALIASPHYLHPVHATACFARHIHALVEKPAAVEYTYGRNGNGEHVVGRNLEIGGEGKRQAVRHHAQSAGEPGLSDDASGGQKRGTGRHPPHQLGGDQLVPSAGVF